jgi:hypothetical protein
MLNAKKYITRLFVDSQFQIFMDDIEKLYP